MVNAHTITEYESLHCGIEDDFSTGVKTLSERHFKALESFVLSTGESSQVMRLTQEGNQRVLKAQNYVGLIQLDDGFQVEILPKVLTHDIPTTKKVFLEMLRHALNVKFRWFNLANVDTTQGTILEVFIETFLAEVENILKGGLYADYQGVIANERYLNGKLLVSKHVQENYAHRERFYIKYDAFTQNCSENRLIKSTLVLLSGLSQSVSNRNAIQRLLQHFVGVETSKHYDQDFATITENRNNRAYRNALSVAKVFLKRETFTNYTGDGIAYALLFPMDTIFERYVANVVKTSYPQYSVTLQDASTYLCNGGQFPLRPDIVVRNVHDLSVRCIMDTKWKLLDPHRHNYGISIQDMYQTYAYAKRFNCKDVVLLYPKPNPTIESISYHIDDVTVAVRFADLYALTLEHIPFIL